MRKISTLPSEIVLYQIFYVRHTPHFSVPFIRTYTNDTIHLGRSANIVDTARSL